MTDPFYDKEFAQIEARAYMGLYVRTRNGVFFWKAFAEYRRAGLPIPESLLRKLDQFAERLMRAEGQAAIAKAVEMTNPKGGPQGAAYAAGMLRTRQIVAAVHERLWPGSPHGRMAVYRLVARRFRKTPKQVGDIYRAWMAASGPRKQSL
jgi:hypothetical protein